MRALIHGENPPLPVPKVITIPKVLVQFWHDLSELPADVGECLESWTPLKRGGFRRLMFDDNKAWAFIREQLGEPYVSAFGQCRHPAMRCDYFRLCYIYKNGGFYVDADEVYQGGEWDCLYTDNRLKVQPLCYDTRTDSMVHCAVFMGQKAYSPDWILYVNNNPIVAPSLHPVIGSALARATRLLLASVGRTVDIQSTTGPGNLTACLVQHSVASSIADKPPDFLLLKNWDAISICHWPLSYRLDERNWRLWKPTS